ncbi:MAG TPA: hypothetical protein PKA06_12255, partial [Gemmatales bacterium]|nr:hypothetical protein [Gemmatales bacterium]
LQVRHLRQLDVHEDEIGAMLEDKIMIASQGNDVCCWQLFQPVAECCIQPMGLVIWRIVGAEITSQQEQVTGW